MANDQTTGRSRDGAAAQERAAPQAANLGLETPQSKGPKEAAGFNPYDTTGGFDRKKNWAQVRKR